MNISSNTEYKFKLFARILTSNLLEKIEKEEKSKILITPSKEKVEEKIEKIKLKKDEELKNINIKDSEEEYDDDELLKNIFGDDFLK